MSFFWNGKLIVDYKVGLPCVLLLRIDEMEDLVAMSNELGESIGRSYEVPDCILFLSTSLMVS